MGSDAFVCVVHLSAVRQSYGGRAGGFFGRLAGRTDGFVGAWNLRGAPSPRPSRVYDLSPSP